ncbi:MAG: putative cytochrome [Pseudonocardiales bacterium]|nr:putative cytochrome [Pseudonocardiales bacterium]
MPHEDIVTAAIPAETADSAVPELLAHFDFFDPRHADRAEEVLRYARGACPVAHTSATGGYYIATTYEHAAGVLSDPATFSSSGYTNIAGNGGVMIPPIDTDPPLHHEFRSLINPFFHPKFIAEREPRIREIARATMQPWIDSGECEFIKDFAAPFVTDVLAKVVFEADDPELFREAAECNDRVAAGDQAAFVEFRDLMIGFVDRHQGQGSDITTAVKNGTIAGRSLTHDEQVGVVQILFSGGLDTTKVAISDILCELAQRPELEDRLRTTGWEKSTLDELLRHSSPVGALGRVVTRTVELGGQQLRKGDRVLVHYSSANHDATTFDSPDDLVFDRARNPHLAFGLGIHRCVGIHLARAQVRVAVSELLTRMTGIRLAPGADLRRRPGISRVLTELPLRFDSLQ